MWITFPLVVILLHIPFQTLIAQNDSQFNRIAPAHFDTLPYKPTAFAIGDINNDQFEDILLVQDGAQPLYFLFNPDSGKVDFKTPIYFGTAQSNIGGVYIIDMDNDQKNDIFLIYNLYNKNFAGYTYDETADSVISRSLVSGLSSTHFRSGIHYNFFDYDLDGKMDALHSVQTGKTPTNFFISNVFRQNNEPHALLNNDLTNSYVRTTSTYAFDFNKDHFIDLFEVAGILSANGVSVQQDQFYRGTESGIVQLYGHPLTQYTSSYGLAVGDYNNDTYLDIFQPLAGGSVTNKLYKNNADGSFTFTSVENTLTRDQLESRSAMWGDINNDGYLDLVVAEYKGGSSTGAYVSLYQNNGPDEDGKINFSKRIVGGLPELNAFGNWQHVTLWDYNHNGQLDIIAMGLHQLQPIILFENKGVPGNNWVGFDLSLTNSFYPEPYNVKVTLEYVLNGQTHTLYREISPMHGFHAQQSMRVHFGINQAASATVYIKWPNSLTSTVELSTSELNQYREEKEPDFGKLNVQSVQPYPVAVSIDKSLQDTIRFMNIGQGSFTISNSIYTSSPYLTVTGHTTTIAPGEDGYIAFNINPANNSAYLGSRKDTIRISIVGVPDLRYTYLISTQILTQPVDFGKVQPNDNEYFLTIKDGYSNTILTNMGGDNNPDLFVFRNDSLIQQYQFKTGFFERVNSAIFEELGSITTSLTAGDINNDRFQDLLFSRRGRADLLYYSDSDGNLIPASTSFENDITATTMSTFVDVNGDGRLDIVQTLTNAEKNRIYLQDIHGGFKRKYSSVDDFIRTQNFANFHRVADLNGDSRPDIIVTQKDGQQSDRIQYFQQNEAGHFKSTLIDGITNRSFSSNGILVIDYNNDTLMDLLIISDSYTIPAELWEQQPDFTFKQVYTDVFNAISGRYGDAVAFDYNSDGYLDFFFTDNRLSNDNRLIQSKGGEGFLIITTGEILNNTDRASYGALPFDYNEDGRPDLLISNFLNTSDLYINEFEENNWLIVRPRGLYPDGNSGSLTGVIVQVEAVINGKPQTQTRILGYDALKSLNYFETYFGLLDATTANVTIKDYSGREIELNNVSANTIIEPELIGVNIDSDSFLPDKFILYNAYPNPFNPTTTLSFTLPQSGNLQIEMFDILGRKVRNINENYPLGTHSITINANGLSSGVYLIRIIWNGTAKTMKVTLLK